MKYIYLFFLLFLYCTARAQNRFQLAPPLIKYSSIFFDERLSVPIVFEQPGAYITYSIDGETSKAKKYNKPILINKELTTIKARANSKDFTASEIVEATFIKSGIPAMVHFPEASGPYKSSKPSILSDNQGGITNHNSPTWLGYDKDSVSLIIETGKVQNLHKVLFNVLENQQAWIFTPSRAVVYAYNKQNNSFSEVLGTVSLPMVQNTKVQCRAITMKLIPSNTDKLKLVLYNTKLPSWHQGVGKLAWMFIDEVKLY
ncbi:hypothetical protein G7074_15255 [Pedobacter sp. HDW13]|uniref:FN3 associated domain-containing protein n=1 Tax=Pedobacter sp. HDW13 TaxID=2714940 RepID=UPI001407EF50|nr:FN3 associated domain-containing protein [Pedobacter sp. HDW13]QIL40501.1 hypothetical protein G7074_15255 [Pedobacter sp. HDW13]